MRISDWSSDVCSSDLTNGKTTVTAMTRQLVQACGLSARAAGNISPAALAALSDALDADDLPDVWVLELSSFQLEGRSEERRVGKGCVCTCRLRLSTDH